jgi:hypothetical protein
MSTFALNQRVGNFKTQKVGAILSESFRGASGEFRGFLILTDLYGQEIWEESDIVPLPAIYAKTETPAQK